MNLKDQVAELARPFLPRFFKRVLRSVFRYKSPNQVKFESDYRTVAYQLVTMNKFLYEMHESKFARIHEFYSSLDIHLKKDVNTTRLRNYTLFTWATSVKLNTKSGDFLFAGVSYGTSALVINELLTFPKKSRRFILLDPMDGRGGNHNYNTDLNHIDSNWVDSNPKFWIRKPLTNAALKIISSLAFVHLNTGSWDSECKTLPLIFQKLVPHGIIVVDAYGWKSRDLQLEMNELLVNIGAKYFVTPSLQLIIMK